MGIQPQLPAPQKPDPDSPEADPNAVAKVQLPVTNPLTGGRQSFRDIKRQLVESDLQSPGVQRMLLEELERAENQCSILQGYVDRFHDADKRAAILTEKLKTQTALEIFFGVGVGVGCAMVGLAPSLWAAGLAGPLSLILGGILVLGSAIGRIAKQ